MPNCTVTAVPQGDNTSDQLGRVENLVCEQIDFAPCTEHQRIESYDDQLEKLGAQEFMATCTGMELTRVTFAAQSPKRISIEMEAVQPGWWRSNNQQ